MVEWLAGNRIRGTSTERTTGAGFNPVDAVSGGWKELARSSSVDTSGNDNRITIHNLANKKYYMVLVNTNASGSVQTAIRIGTSNSILTSGYVTRSQSNGTGGSSNVQSSSSVVGGQVTTGSNGSNFDHYFIENIVGKEKLIIGFNISTNGTVSTAIERAEIVSKNTTTSALTSIELFDDTAGTFDTGTEVVVLGWDPADTHTDNFWEPLATATGSSSSASFNTGTFTAKKYLMVTGYAENTQSFTCSFNDGASGSYCRRYYGNGNADVVGNSTGYFGLSLGTTKVFFVQMIANPSNSYKLIHQVNSEVNSDNSASTQPNQFTSVTKWQNNAQITKMTFGRSGGNFSGDEKITVWGHN